jgi:hypothetical protein
VDRRHAVAVRTAEAVVDERHGASARLAHDEYLPLIASAPAHTMVGVARPEGFEHTPPTIVIEGVAALVEALRAA